MTDNEMVKHLITEHGIDGLLGAAVDYLDGKAEEYGDTQQGNAFELCSRRVEGFRRELREKQGEFFGRE